jgi:hypothetical protein
MRRVYRYGAMPVAAALLMAGCGSATADSADDQFIADISARGVPTSPSPPPIGHDICKDLDDGFNLARDELVELSNLKADGEDQPHYTLRQAAIITYWAVTDLCPQYSSQLQPYWRDGGAPN